MLTNAIEIAARVHEGQLDKVGDPYIFHPLRVMLAMDREPERISGILHDVIENSEWTLDDLRAEGFSEEIIEIVDCLSRRDEEEYADYIDRVLANSSACRVKLADLDDNLRMQRQLAPSDETEEQLLKYEGAKRRILNRLTV